MKQITAAAYRFEPSIQAIRNCRKARQIALWSVLLCGFGQLLIDASGVNVICVFIVATISAATFHFVIKGSVFRALPLPALIVLGFNVSTMSGALIAQTLSQRSLVYNLQVPQITFALCALFQISLLVALFIFLWSSSLRSKVRTINRRVFARISIMQAPSPLQLWIMGLVGSAAMLWSAPDMYSDTKQYGDVGAKFIAGMGYLAFAPFVVPILDKIYPSSRASSTVKASKWLLLGYIALLLVIAMIRNSRGIFMMGITNLGIAALLLMLLGQLRVTARLRRGLVIGAVMALMVAPIMADLAIAMVVARDERTNVSGTELVVLTLAAFNNKPALEQYRVAAAVLAGGDGYDENYLANPFVARFVNTKFFDNSLSYEDVRTGDRTAILWTVTLDKIGALLPTPVLDGLGIGINKENLQFSMGDALNNAQTGSVLGGYKTGSPIGHGMGLMGFFVFIAVVPLFLLAFMAVQSLTLSVGSFVVISPVILLQLMSVYSLATMDSLLDPVTLMLRTLPQNILIYWLVFQTTHWITKSRQRRPGSAWVRGPDSKMYRIGDSNTIVTRRLNS
jgi:hypothetical protein